MLAAVLRDAGRQYRRRPLAVVLVVALQAASLALEPATPAVQVALAVPLLFADLLLELFLIAYLAGALAAPMAPVGEALAAARRSVLPGIRAFLLLAVYLLLALLVGMLLFGGQLGSDQPGAPNRTEQTAFVVGVGPLFGLALAFLAVLRQRIVLGGERRVLAAAAVSHRVAGRHFPICLLIGLVQAAGLVVVNLDLGRVQLVATGVAFALVSPFLIGMGNALYLRTSELYRSSVP